jgi:diguanylate cyclase (GGDEF)-like protein
MANNKIMLVQNAQRQGSLTRRTLEDMGYDVIWVGSGVAALATVKQNPPELILIDAILPDIEGIYLCRWLRLSDHRCAVPILLLSDRALTATELAGPEGGPDDCLKLPFAEQELAVMVSSALNGGAKKSISSKNGSLSADLRVNGDELVVIDPATGLFSRQQFEAMFSKDFKRALRFKQALSCMLIDLDGRKIGRSGDEATLKSIVKLVQHTIREVDTAAWWSGEVLIILLPNTMHDDAVQAAARVLEAVACHPFTWADCMKVTMNIGVAGLPDPAIDTEQKLIEAAAAACKRAGDLMLPSTSGKVK